MANPSLGKAGIPSALPDQLAKLLQEFGIPKDTAAIFTIQALMQEGLGLKAESLRAVRSLALRHGSPRRAAVLAARALAAGLHADDEGLDALIRLLSGPGTENNRKEPEQISARHSGKDNDKGNETDTGSGSGRGSGGNTGEEAESGSGKDPERRGADDGIFQGQVEDTDQDGLQALQALTGQNAVQKECQDEAELQQALESAFVALSSRAAADPGFASLARRGPDGCGWLCVPFQFTIDGVDFSGYFRIIFNYATSKVERLVAEIDSSGLTRVCDVSWSATGRPMLRFMPGSLSEGQEFSRLFGESMGVELVHPAEGPGSIDTHYREVDGHV